MSEEELNEQYIRNKIGGICQDRMWLDKTIPIIREMLSKTYIDGLEQSRFDKTMLEIENQQLKLDYELYKDNHIYKNYEVERKDNTIKQLKEVIDEIRKYTVGNELLQILDKVKGEDND